MSLEIKNISIAYKGLEAVRNVSFNVKEGKITVIIGANGVGKSSILKGIIGIVKPTQGQVLFKGQDLLEQSSSKRTSIGIAMCPEGRQLFHKMTVQENLEMGAYSLKTNTLEKDLNEIYERFSRLSERRYQRAETLSGGEQELVAIARSLMAKPELLILDEPSWGLAPIMIDEVINIIKEINEAGTTILLVEQNANLALKIADYAYVLDVDGFVMEGTGEELLNNKEVQRIYLGA